MTIKQLKQEIQSNIEWLETTEGDEIECIGIENLEGIISRFIGRKIILSLDTLREEEEEDPFSSKMFKQLKLPLDDKDD